jgi:hypothetical protein
VAASDYPLSAIRFFETYVIMGLMVRRPPRIVIALARWALMAGLAGIVLAMLAFIDHFRAPENLESRRNLLVVAAILLSLSFVFAPFVRRAFVVVLTQQPKREQRKTLLDEMREHPEGEWQPSGLPSPPATTPSSERSVVTKLIVILYVVFGAALVAVVFALQ